jgi:hypothetical protein
MTDPNIEPIKERIARLRKQRDDLEWHLAGCAAHWEAGYAEQIERLNREIAHLEADRRAGVDFIPKF